MKRRLRLICCLLALCALGTYGFQAYWLYGTYRLATAQFGALAGAALQAVVQQQQLARANKVFRLVLDDRRGPAITARPARGGGIDSFVRLRVQPLGEVRARTDSLRAHRPAGGAARLHTTLIYSRSLGKGVKLGLPPAGIIRSIAAANERADSLARRLSGLVISSWEAPQAANLPQLARAYRAELRRRRADVPFRLDTLGPRAAAGAAAPAGYPLRTPAVPLNPLRGPAVAASFRAPTAYVLRGMAGSLAGSALLLALTTGCFGLMLSTIVRQKKLSEVRSDFINNMTHELKTPLATVSAAAEALQDFGALADPLKTDTYLTIARQELRRLADLVERVLRSAAEERHGLAVHPAPVRPAALVAGLVARHRLQAPKPVQFAVDVPAADAVPLDAVHFEGVVNNLIDNAIKYSEGPVAIGIRARVRGAGWEFTVSDDGLGIPAEYQAAVFDQFFRVPTGNLHAVKGFGLGLYYVRQVVAAHGGRVAVRSAPGRGSAFSLWLPLTAPR